MLGKLFGKKNDEQLKENEVRIVLPEDSYTLIEYQQEDLPGVAMVNSGLLGFEHKVIFRWHLSVIIDFEDIIEKGMPSEEETKAGGNALFLVGDTWNQTRRLAWMVYDPEIANQHLQYIIEHHRHPRPFDYRMEEDIEWKRPEWYLSAVET